MFTKMQCLGQLLLCRGCCCGQTEKGMPAVPVERIKGIWRAEKLNRTIQLTISGCLGPCEVPNVVLVIIPGETVWLGRIAGDDAYDQLIEWGRSCQREGNLLPLPDSLLSHRLERFAQQEALA